MADKALITCLWFDTEGEAAAKHYTSIFKDSKLGIVPYGEAGRREAEMTMLVEFELNGQKFIALNGGPQFKHSEAISFQIPCEDQEGRLLLGQPHRGRRGGPCGWLRDRFGVSWQVVPTGVIELMGDPDPERPSGRARRSTRRWGRSTSPQSRRRPAETRGDRLSRVRSRSSAGRAPAPRSTGRACRCRGCSPPSRDEGDRRCRHLSGAPPVALRAALPAASGRRAADR